MAVTIYMYGVSFLGVLVLLRVSGGRVFRLVPQMSP